MTSFWAHQEITPVTVDEPEPGKEDVPEVRRVISRFRAALRLLSWDDITPQGRRILEKILDEEEGKR